MRSPSPPPPRLRPTPFPAGTERILELTPTGIHCRCPVILGSKRDVDAVVACLAEGAAADAAAAAEASAAAAEA